MVAGRSLEGVDDARRPRVPLQTVQNLKLSLRLRCRVRVIARRPVVEVQYDALLAGCVCRPIHPVDAFGSRRLQLQMRVPGQPAQFSGHRNPDARLQAARCRPYLP